MPVAHPAAATGYVQIKVLACGWQRYDCLVAAVVVAPPGDLCRLTRRELAILGLLVEGWTTGASPPTVFVAERTVAAHVERILFKFEISGAQQTTADCRQCDDPRGLAQCRPGWHRKLGRRG